MMPAAPKVNVSPPEPPVRFEMPVNVVVVFSVPLFEPSIVQSVYGLEAIAYELNLEGARLARLACDEWTDRTPEKPRRSRRIRERSSDRRNATR